MGEPSVNEEPATPQELMKHVTTSLDTCGIPKLALTNHGEVAPTCPARESCEQMRLFHLSWLSVLTLLVQRCRSSLPVKRSYSTHDYFVLEHNLYSGASLDECANELGVEVVERVGEMRNTWLVRRAKTPLTLSQNGPMTSLRTRAAARTTSFWARSDDNQRSRRVLSSIDYFAEQIPRQRAKRDDSLIYRAPPPIDQNPNSPVAVAASLDISDPLFPSQWHIINEEFPEHMMNVTGLWEMGITGQGIITSVVDDGLDYNSTDLAENFVRYP